MVSQFRSQNHILRKVSESCGEQCRPAALRSGLSADEKACNVVVATGVIGGGDET
jgi:hypothetical protein